MENSPTRSLSRLWYSGLHCCTELVPKTSHRVLVKRPHLSVLRHEGIKALRIGPSFVCSIALSVSSSSSNLRGETAHRRSRIPCRPIDVLDMSFLRRDQLPAGVTAFCRSRIPCKPHDGLDMSVLGRRKSSSNSRNLNETSGYTRWLQSTGWPTTTLIPLRTHHRSARVMKP
jgi:hypothetical protein